MQGETQKSSSGGLNSESGLFGWLTVQTLYLYLKIISLTRFKNPCDAVAPARLRADHWHGTLRQPSWRVPFTEAVGGPGGCWRWAQTELKALAFSDCVLSEGGG